MTLGLFGARADHRGLSSLTALMYRCLRPEKTVVVNMGTHSPTAFHPEAFTGPGVTTVQYDDLLAGDHDYGPFLDGLTHVICFETPYDFGLFRETARRHIHTTLVLMPELDPYQRTPELPRPDVLALPTPWLHDRYPGVPVLPVPCEPFDPEPGALVVHPGALAMKDRNGTRVVIDASVLTARHLTIRCQAPPEQPWRHARVEVDDLPDSENLYDGAALVVVPRRYGGLSLVMQEAMAAGLPLLVPSADPYADGQPMTLACAPGRVLHAKGGSIPTWDVAASHLAWAVDEVMHDDGLLKEMGVASARWAAHNTWSRISWAWESVIGERPAA